MARVKNTSLATFVGYISRESSSPRFCGTRIVSTRRKGTQGAPREKAKILWRKRIPGGEAKACGRRLRTRSLLAMVGPLFQQGSWEI